jgi:hypothetical protein
MFSRLTTLPIDGKELSQYIERVEKQRTRLFQSSSPRRACFIVHHERIANLQKYLYSKQQLQPVYPIGMMNPKQLASRGLPKKFHHHHRKHFIYEMPWKARVLPSIRSLLYCIQTSNVNRFV